MINKIISASTLRHLSNIPGFSTKRRLVIIESDDWGSIRMPSKEAFKNLTEYGIDLVSDEGARFNKYDTLASAEDFSALYEVLSSVNDYTGRSAVITPISVLANPDFKKIEDSRFSEYFYEPFTETLRSIPGCESSYDLWKEGIEKRLFVPQFHGREHLNVKPWLRALRDEHKATKFAFDNKLWGISTSNDPKINLEFQAAFDFIDTEDIEYHQEVITTGLDLFENLLGYRATFFVPPNGPFSEKLMATCADAGIKYLSTSKVHHEPIGQRRTKKRFHWLGQKESNGITYMTRNCFFEPSDPAKDWVDSCLEEISSAFRWKKPAIISSHRVNYIGVHDKRNRDKGLAQLKTLLKQILKNWPETEFITSEELGNIITNER